MKMKVIFSRKGFDSSYGGFPSIILPDGQMISFPIPEKGEKSVNNYYDKITKKYYKQTDAGIKGMGAEDIKFMRDNGPMLSLKKIFIQLKKEEIKIPKKIDGKRKIDVQNIDKTLFHYDPQIQKIQNGNKYAAFGQSGAAATHLLKHIKQNDLFLFFGTFKKLNNDYTDDSDEFHALWGYMFVDDVFKIQNDDFVHRIGDSPLTEYQKIEEHPHYLNRVENGKYTKNNIIICSKDGRFGTFNFNPQVHKLTENKQPKSHWKFPECFKCFDGKEITYHTSKISTSKTFISAPIGQEFVIKEEFDISKDNDFKEWLKTVLKKDEESLKRLGIKS